MQGLFQLGIVGSREELISFIKKSQENELLKNSGIAAQMDSELKAFLSKYRLVMKSTSSGNINGIEQLADEISKVSPELEVALIIQYLDSCGTTDWFLYYCPSGETTDVAQMELITKGEEVMTWFEMQELMMDGLACCIDGDEVWDYYQNSTSDFSDFGLTRELLDYFLAEQVGIADEQAPAEYEEKETACQCLLEEFFDQKAGNAAYFYDVYHESLPSLAYLSRLFEQQFVQNYRFVPQTFDKRFEGKVFVITGAPHGYGHEQTVEFISKFGGKVRKVLSEKTNYLIVGDYPDESKQAKAKELGTKIIDVEAFEEMISQ